MRYHMDELRRVFPDLTWGELMEIHRHRYADDIARQRRALAEARATIPAPTPPPAGDEVGE